MPLLAMEGWVLKGIDYSETSRIVTLWTKEKGKIRALAKGARRLKSPFENALDLLNLCRFQVIHKGGNSLDLITESRVVDAYRGLRNHLPNLYAAYHVAELLAEGTEDLDPHPDLFEGVHDILGWFSREAPDTRIQGRLSPEASWVLIQFEFFYLSQTGYLPNFQHCHACNRVPTPKTAKWTFHADAGAIFCEECYGTQVTHSSHLAKTAAISKSRLDSFFPSSHPISPDALDAAGRLGNREQCAEVVAEKIRMELRALLNHYLTWLRGRRPKLIGFLGG